MEKIVITPNEVRALGNIVTKRESADDFIGINSLTSRETGIVEGHTMTVYKSLYKVGSYFTLTGPHFVESDESLTVDCVLCSQFDGGYPLRDKEVECTVNGVTYSQHTDNDGECTFTITGLTDGWHSLRFYYAGGDGVSSCFKNFTVVVGGTLDLDLTCTRKMFQTGDYNELFATLTSSGIGVPYTMVQFYEEFIATYLRVKSSMNPLQTGDSIDITAKLSDEDGSAIPNTQVDFYEYYTPTILRLSVTDNPIQVSDTTEVSAVLKDEDGSLIMGERVDFSKDIDSTNWRLYLYPASQEGTNMQIGDEIDITMRVRDASNNPVEGVYVRFYDEKE